MHTKTRLAYFFEGCECLPNEFARKKRTGHSNSDNRMQVNDKTDICDH